jgi:hypothetical protein
MGTNKLDTVVKPYALQHANTAEFVRIQALVIVHWDGQDTDVPSTNAILTVQPTAEHVLVLSNATVQKDGRVQTA